MTDAEKMDYATTVFEALVGEKQDRLTRGILLRQAMHDAISRGEKPSGYRAQWIKSQSLALVKNLSVVAEGFDNAHPDDKCSVSDLLDLLATTMGLFKAAAKD